MTAPTLGALLTQQAGEIVGRARERAELRRVVEPDGPVVAYVHGLAGVGKSTLVRAFAAEARETGVAVLELDGHAVATEGELLLALGGSSVEAAAAAVGAREDQVVLTLDAFERFGTLDGWLARTLLPALPAHVRVVIAGRDAPADHWRGYGPLLSVMRLANMRPTDAVALLRSEGVDAETAPRINSIVRGHPLSLRLAVAALRNSPGLAVEEIAAGTVGAELARLYLDGLDPLTRRALNAAALTRRTTLTLLDAMLPDIPATEAFERLRSLPFVELGADGLLVHDTVREATAALLRAADPQEYWRMRTAAWSRLRAELRGAPERDLYRYMADLLYLIDDEGVRDAFFAASACHQHITPARPEDLTAMEELAGDDAGLVRAWWESAPETFRVTRDAPGAVAGFTCLAAPIDVSPRLIDSDPLAARWRAHQRRDPPPRSHRTLFLRWIVGRCGGARSALILDVTRTYMELRPELRRVYARAADLVGADPSSIGYVPLEDEPDTVCMDFGPASVEGWLADLGARQRLAGDEDREPADLTPLEAQVLAYLRGREGQPVARAALLRDVWGYEWTGGSNVVEVVISSLRRKLGDECGIATVRGVGYRYLR
ncbi:MAG TPA: winged helix-turn-helix domain-containing protein [Solirubrobacteraceae bacterium]|nr:winged helix-turn-helix domain-containing protein [Solirubrobacteraceae bacterium]